MRAEEGDALHVWRWPETGQAEHGGREIHEAHQAVHRLSRRCRGQVLILLGPADDERLVQTCVVQRPFAARQAAAVVPVEEHDRVLGQTVGGQFVQDPPDLLVHGGNAVVIAGQRPAHRGRVGIVRRHRCPVRVMPLGGREHLGDHLLELLLRPHAGPRLVRDHQVKDAEEWLSGPALRQ